MTQDYLKTNSLVIGTDASSGGAANPLVIDQPILLSAGPVAYTPADDGLVKITNGNVAVFDDVVVIENIKVSI